MFNQAKLSISRENCLELNYPLDSLHNELQVMCLFKYCVYSFPLMLLITLSSFLLLVLFHLKCTVFFFNFNDMYYVKSSTVHCLNGVVNGNIDPLWVCAACTKISLSVVGTLLLQILVGRLRKTQTHIILFSGLAGGFLSVCIYREAFPLGQPHTQ